MGFFITEIGSSIEGCCLWNKTIQNASSHGFSKPHEFCINYNFFYVWYMVRFMLIVFISNQIEDTIDFDETIHLERGQNLFEIHVQKARNFLDSTAPCTHFLSEVNWNLNVDAYYFVNIWSFIGPIILWHYITSKLFDTYVSPNYSVHVVVNVHLQLYMCLLNGCYRWACLLKPSRCWEMRRRWSSVPGSSLSLKFSPRPYWKVPAQSTTSPLSMSSRWTISSSTIFRGWVLFLHYIQQAFSNNMYSFLI